MTTASDTATPPIVSLAERAVLSRVIAVATGKGGILKTSTICAIAAAAARYLGMKVLVVDMDPQGTTSQIEFSLENTEHNDNGESLGESLMHTYVTRQPHAPKVVEGVATYPSGGRVDVVVGGSALGEWLESIAMISYTQKRKNHGTLAVALSAITPGYDLVLIDNDPGDKTARLMVMTAARATYAPIDYDPAAYRKGLNVLIEETAEARVDNPDLFFLGAVACRLPEPTIRAWRKTDKSGAPRPGGRMVKMAERINAILADEVFKPQAEQMPGYPKIFNSMIRLASGTTADAREAMTNIVDYLHSRDDSDEDKVLDEVKLAADYEALVNEMVDAIIELETRARATT